MNTVLLTIAIPTFNRAAKLQAQLERLLPQLTPEVQVSIYDNASTDSTKEVAQRFPNLDYSCSPCNSGGTHNFFRGFEGCKTEWLWILSDDDQISPTAVADLLNLLKGCQADFVHTSSPLWQHYNDKTLDSVPDLLYPLFGSLIWISTGIYRISTFRPLFWHYNSGMSTTAPHLLMVLTMLEKKLGKVFFSTTSLVTQLPDPAPRWSTLDFITRISRLPEYLQDQQNQTLLAQCIYNQDFYWAMIIGTRELENTASIRHWQRVRKLVQYHFKTYGAKSPILDFITHQKWKLPNGRNKMLRISYYTVLMTLLAGCPSRWFLLFYEWFPKPITGQERMFPKNSKEKLNIS